MTYEEEMKIKDALALAGHVSDLKTGRLNLDTDRRIRMERFCAVHDKPYMVLYAPAGNGLYRFKGTHEPNGINYFDERQGEVPKRRVQPIDRSLLDPNSKPEECHYCKTPGRVLPGLSKASSFVQCGSCKKLVCLGKTLGSYFYCGASCGGHGEMVNRTVPMFGSITDEDTGNVGTDGGNERALESRPWLRLGNGLWI